MNDRSLVTRLLEIGVAAHRKSPNAFATPSDAPDLESIGSATISNWLEKLGHHRLIGAVEPVFTRTGAGFRFRVTNDAVRLWSDRSQFDAWLDELIPSAPAFDVFISYAAGDAAIADELRGFLEKNGVMCFMAAKDIRVATEWQDSIRESLIGSSQVLVLLTPRSINRPWVLMETGAAWALGKPLIPALSHVDANDLLDPIRRHQARVIETTAQRQSLVDELTRLRTSEQLSLVERPFHQVHQNLKRTNDLDAQLALMAAAPEIQNEMERIEQEFAYAEADGLENP